MNSISNSISKDTKKNNRKDNIKVLFVYPPVRLNADPRFPPFGMLYMGSVLEKAGISVEIIDINCLRLDFKSVLELIAEKDFDIIGTGGMTTVYYYMKLLSLHLKKRYPHVKIMGGGSACSATPETVLRNSGIDVACIGEGEDIIVELVRRLVCDNDISDISGIAYIDKIGEFHLTKDRPRISDIMSLPYPAYHLVDMETYMRNNSKVYAKPSLVKKRVKEIGIDIEMASRPFSLFSKRGCPFGCNFCFRNFGRKVVYTDVDHILDHMSFAEQEYNTAHFLFNDEIFNINKGWVIDFCNAIISQKRKYILGLNNGLRANVCDRELLELMYKAGFRQCGIGIESFYEPTLKAMGKGQTRETIMNAVTWAQEVGLFVNSVQFLFGYETDGMESMKANIKAVEELGLTRGNFSIPCPYPGTYLYDIACEKGLIGDEESWLLELADRDIADRVINMSGMSDEKLLEIVQWGEDQLRLIGLRLRHSTVASCIGKVQSQGRRLNIDVFGVLERLWSYWRTIKPHKNYKIEKDAAQEVYFWDSDDRNFKNQYLRDEVFDLLAEWDKSNGTSNGIDNYSALTSKAESLQPTDNINIV